VTGELLSNRLHGSAFKVPKWRSTAFLRMVHEFPCSRCSACPPSDPHHFGSDHGKAQKVDDFRVVPLCRRCHDGFHAGLWGRTDEEKLAMLNECLEMIGEFLRTHAARCNGRLR